jgi:DNA repair protein RecN (Recombination protein N)
MLRKLVIESFALVDKLEIDFEPGMNVLTGETGAGKSVIVGAIAQLLGEKADRDDIRSGSQLAVIEGEFVIAKNPEIESSLHEYEIEIPDKTLTIRKEIQQKGSSRNFINNRMVTLTQLREITKYLAELFGQHSHQQLLDENNHLHFLDQFAILGDDVEKLKEIYSDWENTRRDLANRITRREQAKTERELLIFQKNEIEKARIRDGEEAELTAEKKILDSSRFLGEKATNTLGLLESDDHSPLDLLRTMRKELSAMINIDHSLEKEMELLDGAIINLDEFRSNMESYRSAIPDDPSRQEEINLRLDEIFRLKKKYGGSEEAVLATLEQISNQLGAEIDIDQLIGTLTDKEKRLAEEYQTLALDISAQRKKAALDLAKAVQKELRQLGIESAKFEYYFEYTPDNGGILLDNQRVKPGPTGLESGHFLVSANPGEPLKPLARTASGGEISRIMMALRAANNKASGRKGTLLVMDEIDAGIGGQTAKAVALKLADLARDYQLLVITHLHQIASLADHHYAVEKTDTKSGAKRKVIAIKKLNAAECKKEIERMISLPE